jgi:hypothetical protein
MQSNIFSPDLEHSAPSISSNGQLHNASEVRQVLEYVEWRHENLTFEQYGFKQSGAHGGDPAALEAELNKIYSSFKSKADQKKAETENATSHLRESVKALCANKQDVKVRIDTILEKIQTLMTEIASIRKDPSSYQSARPNKISFMLGCIIAFLLTIYLWIFYSSASYSAFFRKFQADDINVANSIFDARSVYNAWQDGLPAFILIASMPFVFLALGYLIHKFMLLSSWLKWISIMLLVLVTFFFDFIIAYEIVKKIYDLKVANSLKEMPEYTVGMAWKDAHFWLIIFAGFVTYLIWGFLFDKLIADHDKFDVVNYQIRIREATIQELKKQMEEEQQKAKQMEADIIALEEKIRNASMANHEPQVDPSILHQFITGWIGFITASFFPAEQKSELIAKINEVVRTFFVNHHLQINLIRVNQNTVNNESA